MMALAYELQHMKNEAPMVFDKLSVGDYTVAAAFTTIQAAGGPVMLDDFFYGRKDAASAGDCNPLSNIPTANNYVDCLKEKGFTDEQIVALTSVEAFGIVQDPVHTSGSIFPRFTNYYYKNLLSSSDSDKLPHARALLGSDDLRTIVEKYAEDQEEFHKVFKGAFVQLCELGTGDELVDVEEFVKDHPDFKNAYPELC